MVPEAQDSASFRSLVRLPIFGPQWNPMLWKAVVFFFKQFLQVILILASLSISVIRYLFSKRSMNNFKACCSPNFLECENWIWNIIECNLTSTSSSFFFPEEMPKEKNIVESEISDISVFRKVKHFLCISTLIMQLTFFSEKISSDKKLFFQLIADIKLVKMREKKLKKIYFSYFFFRVIQTMNWSKWFITLDVF